MTGFRVALGGAQALYGITPDLTTLGKIVGGGLPIGAYGGRADIMDHVLPAGRVFQAGTLSGNPVATAAGIATLRQLRDNPPYAQLEALGARLERWFASGGFRRRHRSSDRPRRQHDDVLLQSGGRDGLGCRQPQRYRKVRQVLLGPDRPGCIHAVQPVRSVVHLHRPSRVGYRCDGGGRGARACWQLRTEDLRAYHYIGSLRRSWGGSSRAAVAKCRCAGRPGRRASPAFRPSPHGATSRLRRRAVSPGKKGAGKPGQCRAGQHGRRCRDCAASLSRSTIWQGSRACHCPIRRALVNTDKQLPALGVDQGTGGRNIWRGSCSTMTSSVLSAIRSAPRGVGKELGSRDTDPQAGERSRPVGDRHESDAARLPGHAAQERRRWRRKTSVPCAGRRRTRDW